MAKISTFGGISMGTAGSDTFYARNFSLDFLYGGFGNDVYFIDGDDVVVETSASGGVDTVVSMGSYGLGANLENLTLDSGVGDLVVGTGNDLANVITGSTASGALNDLFGLGGNDTLIGGSGADILDGGTGNDSMKGGKGDDEYVVDSVTDVVVENAGEGFDSVELELRAAANVTYALAANVEEADAEGSVVVNAGGTVLPPSSTAVQINITGNALDNAILGNDYINVLSGGAGDDGLWGFGGKDTLLGGDGNDVLWAGSGFPETDTAGGNRLDGGAGDDVLNGSLGIDTLIGGAGDDLFHVRNAGAVITELALGGDDTVLLEYFAPGSTYTLAANVESAINFYGSDMRIVGNASDNYLEGNSYSSDTLDGGAGNDTLDGKSGPDHLIGGTGNDTFMVDDIGDVVVEADTVSGGVDSVFSTVSHTLSSGVENLFLLEASFALNGTGNAGNNLIQGNAENNFLSGNAGNDTLNGGAGADFLSGGVGNDTFMVDDAGDVVAELSGAGTDKVVSSVSYRLGSNVENLELTGTDDLSGMGNAGLNTITGNAGNNVLNGGGADGKIDTLVGGLGDDTYYVFGNATKDVVTEALSAGTDTVIAAKTGDYTLGVNVENLILISTGPVNGTGNALNNTIRGSEEENVLSGLDGHDSLYGGGGADSLVGGNGNDLLDGGDGDDTLAGGLGNDVYYADSITEVVEAAAAGTDKVVTSGGAASYTLSANLENLDLRNDVASNGTGNSLANVLDSHNGVTGDALDGLGGNDTYIVDGDDVVTESIAGAAGGIDKVISYGTYSLGANQENLELREWEDAGYSYGEAYASIAGYGNELANVVTGSSSEYSVVVGGQTYSAFVSNALFGDDGNDTLLGASGDDTLDGGLGSDLMKGGKGDDVYQVDSLIDLTTENAGEGVDWVVLDIEVTGASATYTLGANLEHVVAYGSSVYNTVTSSYGNLVLNGNAADNTIVGSAVSFNRIAGLAGNDVLIDLYGASTLDGGAGDDFLYGADIGLGGGLGDNILIGGLGNDILVSVNASDIDSLNGGAGNDVYWAESGAKVVEIAGGGNDMLFSAVSVNMTTAVSTATSTGAANVENVVLMGTGDLTGTGSNGADVIRSASTGNDTLQGGLGNDQLYDHADLPDFDAVYNAVVGIVGGDLSPIDLDGTWLNLLAGVGGGADVLDGGTGDDSFFFAHLDSTDSVIGGAGNDALNARLEGGNAAAFEAALNSGTVETFNFFATDEYGYGFILDLDNVTGMSSVNLSGATDAYGYGVSYTLNNLGENAGTSIVIGVDGNVDELAVTLGASNTLDRLDLELADADFALATSQIDTVAFGVSGAANRVDATNMQNTAIVQLSGESSVELLGLDAANTQVALNGFTGVLDLRDGVSTDATAFLLSLDNSEFALELNADGSYNGDEGFVDELIVDTTGTGGASMLALGAMDNNGNDVTITVLGNQNLDLDVRGADTSGGLLNIDAVAFTGGLVVDASTRGPTDAVSVAGGSGSDLLLGGEGDDTLGGGSGDDMLMGGAGGFDTFAFDLADASHGVDFVVDFESGTDLFTLDVADLNDPNNVVWDNSTGNLYWDDGTSQTLFANIGGAQFDVDQDFVFV